MEQQTGYKSGKEYIKAVHCHPAYLTYMQSTSWETLGWMMHKPESRLPGEISITSEKQMTLPFGRNWRVTKEPLDESERREWKSWLKTQHSKTKIMASSPSTSWQIDEETVETVSDFILFSSVQSLSRVQLFATPWTAACQASPTPGAYSNSCPLSWWCHPTVSSSVIPFSSLPQSFPASGSFQMCQLFASGGQSIGVSASTSVLPKKSQDWSPLGWTGWISLQSKGLSRVFSNTTVQKHQFFGAQISL